MANPNRRSSNSNSSSDGPRILSLVEWEVDVTTEVRNHLAQGFRGLYEDASESTAPSHSSSFSSSSQEHVSRILHAMKVPPALTICRLNFCRPERKDKAQVVKELQEQLQDWIRERYSTTTEHGPLQLRPETAVKVVITAHAVMDDVLCVEIRNEKEEQPQQQQQQQQTGRQNESLSLFHCRVPPPPDERVDDNDTDNGFEKPRLPPVPHQPPQQQNDWRRAAGWPLHHKVVITDRLCGEAVLRGADVFVRGVQCADANIVQGDVVAVYTDLVEKISKHPTTSASCSGAQRRLSRGLLLPHYRHPRTAVLVGVGVAACARATMFHSPSGLAVAMRQTAGPHLPPMHAILSPSRRRSSSDFILQNLPSIVVAHVLWPPPMVNGVVAVGASATTTTTAEDHDHDVVVLLDMCAAPGGKTSHLASLLQQDPRWATVTIVACDRSRHKMVQARQLFQRLGCDHTITSLALDTTHCVVRSEEGEPVPSVAEVSECG